MQHSEIDRLELEQPITFGEREIKELKFRELTTDDMRDLKADTSFGDLLDIGARLAGEPKSVISKLRPRDARRLVNFVGNVLERGGLAS